MVIIIISLFMIGLAIVDRFLQTKQSKDTVGVNIIRAIIMIFIYGAIYLLAYFVTDTIIGFIYVFVFLTTQVFYTLNFGVAKWQGEKLTNFLNIIAPTLFIILYVKAISHSLIDMSWILMPIFLSGFILTFSNKAKEMNWKNFMSMILGIGIGLMLIYFYFFHENNNVIQNKQEVVASKFLKEELNIAASTIYSERKLRGEESIVMAYIESGDKLIKVIKMNYSNNSIISYEIKDM